MRYKCKEPSIVGANYGQLVTPKQNKKYRAPTGTAAGGSAQPAHSSPQRPAEQSWPLSAAQSGSPITYHPGMPNYSVIDPLMSRAPSGPPHPYSNGFPVHNDHAYDLDRPPHSPHPEAHTRSPYSISSSTTGTNSPRSPSNDPDRDSPVSDRYVPVSPGYSPTRRAGDWPAYGDIPPADLATRAAYTADYRPMPPAAAAVGGNVWRSIGSEQPVPTSMGPHPGNRRARSDDDHEGADGQAPDGETAAGSKRRCLHNSAVVQAQEGDDDQGDQPAAAEQQQEMEMEEGDDLEEPADGPTEHCSVEGFHCSEPELMSRTVHCRTKLAPVLTLSVAVDGGVSGCGWWR